MVARARDLRLSSLGFGSGTAGYGRANFTRPQCRDLTKGSKEVITVVRFRTSD